LKDFSDIYLTKKEEIKKKYQTIPFEEINTDKNIRLNKLIDDKFKSEKTFINSALAFYNYILEIQSNIYKDEN
jgi:hypothetical protein